jgi:outer membrane protein OmpA-like peptidoglycan-associated protein
MIRLALAFATVPALLATAAHAQQSFTPWDLYLACRGAVDGGPLAGQTSAEAAKLVRFCELQLPQLGRRYATSEREAWRTSTQNLPDSLTIVRLAARGEDVIADRIRSANISRIAGGISLSFRRDEVTLTRDARDQLNAYVETIRATLAQNPDQLFEIVGSADSPEPSKDATNLALAHGRAEQIVAHLVSRGIDRSRLATEAVVVRVPASGAAAPHTVRRATIGVQAGTLPPLASDPPPSTMSGSLGVSALLVGTTDFVLERARAEVEQYLLQAGSAKICATELWKKYLSSTCALILAAQEPGSVQVYLPSIDIIRNAIRNDLRELPFSLTRSQLLSFAKQDTATEVRDAAAFALVLLPYLRDVTSGVAPLKAIGPAVQTVVDEQLPRFAAIPGRGGESGAFSLAYLRQVGTLVEVVSSAREDLAVYWSSSMLVDSVALYSLKTLVLNAGLSPETHAFGDYATEWHDHLDGLVGSARDAQRLAIAVDASWNRLRSTVTDSSAPGHLVRLWTNLLSESADLLFVLPSPALQTRITTFRTATVPILELVASVQGGDYEGAMQAALRLAATSTPGMPIAQQELRLLAFTSDMVEARRSDDVRAALQRFAGAGPGYRAKRHATTSYWRLNAYAGLATGGEWIVDAPGHTGTGGATLGLALPIGIEWGKGGVSGRSLGVFLQMVDLGAIATARITATDSLATFPEFTFGSVVAPGVFVSRGWRNMPVSTVGGVSYLPVARSTTAGSSLGALKLSIFVGVDVPIFP